jgi:Ca2+-binding RTX toxin-like protein
VESVSGSVNLNGGAGTNLLIGPDSASTWTLTDANAGSLNDLIAFASFQNLTGGSADDRFLFNNGGSLAGAIDGGGGTNEFDYSAYTGDITVNLALGTATNVGGSVRNIQNVTGSIGNDILVGDANVNVLRGGTGRNLLIGGAGADQLFGGGGDTILIGGTTLWDTNLFALNRIMAEWTRTDMSFRDRMDHIREGSGRNGRFLLDPRAGNRLHQATVFDDGATDVLTDGIGRDWFFVDFAEDIVRGLKRGDAVTREP